MKSVHVKTGELCTADVDLTVLPCSGRMKQVENLRIQDHIERFGLPSPYEVRESFTARVGGISRLIAPTKGAVRAKYFVFASSVLNKASVDGLENIGRALGSLTRERVDIRVIEAPLLGCGHGALTPDVAVPALARGFLETCNKEAVLELRTDNALACQVAEEALELIWRGDCQAPSVADVVNTHHIVLLVHGIRTYAAWQTIVGEAITGEGVRVQAINYGFMDLARFILPGRLRRFASERILREVEDLSDLFPAVKFSAICHSFGTYAIVGALRANRKFHLHRLILCASVLPEDLRVADFRGQLGDSPVLNDCGEKDIFPVLAKAFSIGYGATGRFGLRTAAVENRFFPFRHSDFLTASFAKKYWRPFIHDGRIVTDGITINREPPSYIISMLETRLLWVFLGIVTIFLFWIL